MISTFGKFLKLCQHKQVIEWQKFDAPSLRNFPMGDPSERSFPVYLPPSYRADRNPGYPLIIVLAGWGSKSSKLVADDSAFGRSLPDELDKRILNQKMPECIVAFPDGTSRLGFGQYVNSPSLGNYQDYICEDIVHFLESKYHLEKHPEFRGITGHSSGGFGTLWIAFQRSDVFQHACASASDSFFEISILSALPQIIPELEKSGGVANFVREFLDHPNPLGQSYSKFLTMMTLSLAPCYAPAPTKSPLLGELFFDLKTGEINSEVWKRYLSFDPVLAVENYFGSLQKMKTLILECGLHDEHAAQLGHRQISKKLSRQGISHELVEYPGKHSGQNWRFADRIEQLVTRMYA